MLNRILNSVGTPLVHLEDLILIFSWEIQFLLNRAPPGHTLYCQLCTYSIWFMFIWKAKKWRDDKLRNIRCSEHYSTWKRYGYVAVQHTHIPPTSIPYIFAASFFDFQCGIFTRSQVSHNGNWKQISTADSCFASFSADIVHHMWAIEWL